MKDTWLDILDSKAFVISSMASLLTVSLVVIYEILNLQLKRLTSYNELVFKFGFLLILLLSIYWLSNRYKRLKDAEFEIEKTKK